MPVLQELKEIMGVIPEKLDTGFQNTSASIAATTVAPTQETVTAQVNRENPTMTKKEVDNIVQQRMKDYSKTEATGVVAKLDQLIDLLKGYSGENVMVKTI
jgi:phage terminase Nu1 subunit (DNA packaging protein)